MFEGKIQKQIHILQEQWDRNWKCSEHICQDGKELVFELVPDMCKYKYKYKFNAKNRWWHEFKYEAAFPRYLRLEGGKLLSHDWRIVCATNYHCKPYHTYAIPYHTIPWFVWPIFFEYHTKPNHIIPYLCNDIPYHTMVCMTNFLEYHTKPSRIIQYHSIDIYHTMVCVTNYKS